MHSSGPNWPGIVRFGVFELDTRAGELRKSGARIRVQEQPFQILVMLLDRPDEVVSREELRRKLWPAEHLTRDHQWNYWHPSLPFLGDEVTGKTIAIIGTGRIGMAMIKKCAGFDMNILCYDPAFQNHDYVKAIQEVMDLRHTRGISKEKNWIKYVEFEEALAQADFLSVHVPLLREGESATPTYHLFNESTLRKMKPTAFLVNTSRGPVVDEAALAKALKDKWIGGAALDVE